jgi:hypothetical protein
MPFMQRITWSGVALHQGVLPGYPASHGCIRMSGDFATRLWGITKIGARVIVARSDVSPSEIAHPHLFAPRPEPKPEPAPKPEMMPQAKPELRPTFGTPPSAPNAALPSVNPAPAEADDPDDMGGGAEPGTLVATAEAPPSADAVKGAANAAMQAPVSLKPGVVSVFVSKKTGRLYVRQNYQPLFDVPVEIRGPERPLGTHVFTAMELQNGGTGMRWVGVTMPGDAPARTEHQPQQGKRKSRQERDAVSPPETKPARAAVDALDRIEIPKEVIERISEMLTPGASLIVSDQGISEETGRDTDFIILTH